MKFIECSDFFLDVFLPGVFSLIFSLLFGIFYPNLSDGESMLILTANWILFYIIARDFNDYYFKKKNETKKK